MNINIMKPQEFVDLTEELNEKLLENKYLENQGICFNYRCYGFVDVICFDDYTVYCSENDSLWDYEENIELSVKDVVIRNFGEYVKALNQIRL